MELTDTVAELYGKEPEGFLVRRKELVAAARAAKDRDAVKAIGALRRPAVAAWLVNLLQRDAAGGRELSELAALGVQLREAQFGLAADRLRELGRERRTRVADLVSRAVDLAEAAGHTVSPAVEREIDETLVAAVADEAAAEAVLSGSLTRPLSYSGFGEVDLDLAVAVVPTAAGRTRPSKTERATEPPPPAPPPEPAPSAEKLRLVAERRARVAEITAALEVAGSALTTASAEASNAAARAQEARSAAGAAARAVAELHQQLVAARGRADASEEQEKATEDRVRTSAQRKRAAQDDIDRLRHELTELT